MKIINNKFIFSILLLSLTFGSCKKDFLENRPTDQVATENVFKTIDGAESAVQGIHRMMYELADDDLFGYPSIALLWDLMGDDMALSGFGAGWFVDAYRINDSRSPASTGAYVWSFFYRIINNSNNILAKIDAIEADQGRKDYVKASALFYRAFAYYNLSNCYMFTYRGRGENTPVPTSAGIQPVDRFSEALCVPIYTDPTTVDNTQGKPRATVEEVYARIVKDITDAIALFEGTAVTRTDKSEISVDVAKGLYARVAMVMGDWALAENMAHEARQGYTVMEGTQVLNGFNDAKNSEWMWGSIINNEQNGIYWSFLSQMDYDMNGYASLGQEKKIASNLFNDNLDTAVHDVRRAWWIGRIEKLADRDLPYVVYSQRKFRGISTASFAGDFPLMRASEMILIEAEAMAMQNKVAAGSALLQDFVKTRQPSYSKSFTTIPSLFREIRTQRRIELWGEGFRYFDIMRYWAPFPGDTEMDGPAQRPMDRGEAGGHNAGIASKMTVTQFSYDYLFRIPASEREVNPDVIQNP